MIHRGACFLLLLVAFSACRLNQISGEFGWSGADDRDLKEPEKSLLVETEFRFGRQRLYFFDYQTIWWIYELEKTPPMVDRNSFLAALYELKNTPDPVEVDLRSVSLDRREGEKPRIRQYYEPLRPGKYLLKLAYKSQVFDQVEFDVVPPGGPAALVHNGDEETVEEDPILRFSRR